VAIHTFTNNANCVVMSTKGSGFLRFSRLCSAYLEYHLDGEDDDRFVDSVNRFSETMPDLVLIPADCDGAKISSRVWNRLKATITPAAEPSLLDCFDSKWRFWQFCAEHGLNVPPTRFIGSKHDLMFASTALELGIPFVVKPVNEAGSKGVYVIFSEEDYDRNIRNNDAYQFAPLIAQRYIQGTEVGLSLLSIQGKVAAIAIQQREYPQHDGAKIKFIFNKYLESVAHTLSNESGYHGVMNIDARIEDGTGKVFLIECNPRFWRSLLASVWCGLNFVGESIEPSLQLDKIRMLTSGYADIYYHPLFRPSLWRYAIFDQGHQGRMIRLMMIDMCILGATVKSILTASGTRIPPAGVPMPRHASL
jgi:predicted ATP-grasp superfamily ATP-dependent carboligase